MKGEIDSATYKTSLYDIIVHFSDFVTAYCVLFFEVLAGIPHGHC